MLFFRINCTNFNFYPAIRRKVNMKFRTDKETIDPERPGLPGHQAGGEAIASFTVWIHRWIFEAPGRFQGIPLRACFSHDAQPP